MSLVAPIMSSLPSSWGDLELPTTMVLPTRLFEHTERLFGALEPDVIFWRDAAGWCPFCEMIWLLLETSEIPYAIRTVPLRRYMLPGEEKDPEYLAAVGPDGVVPGIQFCSTGGVSSCPVVVVQGVENIFEEIQRRYPDRYPGGNNEDLRECACDIFSRLRIARRSYEACAGANRFEKDVLGTLAEALEDLDGILASDETKVDGGPYLGGATSPSISDIMLLPFLERTAAVVPYFFGMEALGNVKFERSSRYLHRARENCWAYSELCSDATTLARTNLKYAEAEAAPRYSVPSVVFNEAAAAEIDGTNPATYKDWADASNREERLEAAARLVRNGPRVTAFAMRCAGLEESGEDSGSIGVVIDAALRIVATLLMYDDGDGDVKSTELAAQIAARALADKYGARAVSLAGTVLEAFSLNVGVPRDMGIYAARALRSHVRILVVAIQR